MNVTFEENVILNSQEISSFENISSDIQFTMNRTTSNLNMTRDKDRIELFVKYIFSFTC